MSNITIKILTILIAFCAVLPVEAVGKKKDPKAEVRLLPVPDKVLSPLKPQKGLSPIKDIGRVPQKQRRGTGSLHTETTRYGIDVSHYQGQINWKEVSRDKRVLFAYLKATESTSFVDNTYSYNIREARANGIPVGCYHFFRPNVSGKAQFEHFRQNVDMSQQDILPMLDIEVRGKESLESFHSKIRDFLEAFEKYYGFKPLLYASVNFYNNYLSGAFDNYKYMIAKYGEGVPSPVGNLEFVTWQFTSSGRIDGIRGAVDRSMFVDHYDVRDILIKNNR